MDLNDIQFTALDESTRLPDGSYAIPPSIRPIDMQVKFLPAVDTTDWEKIRNKPIAVGFGCADLVCDDHTVWFEQRETDNANVWTFQDAENRASQDPDRDWRIHIIAPFYEGHWQRQGEKNWVLYLKSEGFA